MAGFTRRQLGKTGLQVSPIGIGGGSGISSEDLLYAFDRGINYFFFSSDLHHFAYSRSADALRKLCGKGSSVRDQVVLATVTYINDPDRLPSILLDQFAELGIDYIDVFHWGCITDTVDLGPQLHKTQQLNEDPRFLQWLYYQRDKWLQQMAEEVNEDLLRRGFVRHVGASFHSRKQAFKWIHNLDVAMLRYNIMQTEIEQEIAPHLTGNKDCDPGIAVFNVAHQASHYFHFVSAQGNNEQFAPTLPDNYRFALTNSWVDLIVAGLSNRSQIDQALTAIEQGPLPEDVCHLMRSYGQEYIRQQKQARANGQRPLLSITK